MHLCQQTYKREQVFMEVADMHATNLWRQGRYVEASVNAHYWLTSLHMLKETDAMRCSVFSDGFGGRGSTPVYVPLEIVLPALCSC